MENNSTYINFQGAVARVKKDDFDKLIFQKNQTIYMEGSSPLGAYILKKGSIIISKIGSQGKEQVLKILNDGELLGYTDLILKKRYSSSARALTDSYVLFLPKNSFFEILNNDKEFRQKLIIKLANELHNLEHKMVSMAYKPVRGRLADSLLYLNQNSENKDGKITLSRKELAGFTGTVKETVNRLLSEFRKENLILMNRNEIRILNKDSLRRISQRYE